MDALTRGTDAPKLSVRDCCKRFTGAPVLDHVSFDVASGEFLSVLGPSGCGKTTLLRILAGLESPDAGSVLKDGADITRLPPERRSMGLVFQDYALFENMTVRQNVRYALRFHPQLRTQADERTDGLLRLTLREELLQLRREFSCTIVYVTHDQEEALTLSDRVMVMEGGRIRQIDTPENLLRRPADAYVREFVGENLLRRQKALERFFRPSEDA